MVGPAGVGGPTSLPPLNLNVTPQSTAAVSTSVGQTFGDFNVGAPSSIASLGPLVALGAIVWLLMWGR